MDRRDVVSKALEILQQVGLPDLTMRRLGNELGVQQSALYHHYANKQALLGAVADEVLRRGPHTEPAPEAAWEDRVRLVCTDLRTALLAYPDGADVVSSMSAFGLGGTAPQGQMVEILTTAGWDQRGAARMARTVLHFVHGHAVAQQAREAASWIGAITASGDADPDAEFSAGLEVLLAGLQATRSAR